MTTAHPSPTAPGSGSVLDGDPRILIPLPEAAERLGISRWPAKACCPATAAATASLALAKATKKASPSVTTSQPSKRAKAARSSRRCSGSTST